MGETKIGGHLPLLFFFQSIWIDTRQSFNQRSLAVVNVTGGGNGAIWGRDYWWHAFSKRTEIIGD